MRHMCGATNPMNPMVPVKQITPAVTKDASMKQTTLVRLTLTPRLFARSSPVLSVFKSHDFSMISGIQMIRTINITNSLSHDAPARLPNIQYTTPTTAFSSPKNCKTPVIAENKYINAIPARIIVSGDTPL